MVSSTVLTLAVIPAIFALVEGFRINRQALPEGAGFKTS
jgi:Cu/Ag efflux pump CusA